MKLTGWYQGDQRPIRVGYYERQVTEHFTWMAWWNGEYWTLLQRSFYLVDNQNLPWRGVEK